MDKNFEIGWWRFDDLKTAMTNCFKMRLKSRTSELGQLRRSGKSLVYWYLRPFGPKAWSNRRTESGNLFIFDFLKL